MFNLKHSYYSGLFYKAADQHRQKYPQKQDARPKHYYAPSYLQQKQDSIEEEQEQNQQQQQQREFSQEKDQQRRISKPQSNLQKTTTNFKKIFNKTINAVNPLLQQNEGNKPLLLNNGGFDFNTQFEALKKNKNYKQLASHEVDLISSKNPMSNMQKTDVLDMQFVISPNILYNRNKPQKLRELSQEIFNLVDEVFEIPLIDRSYFLYNKYVPEGEQDLFIDDLHNLNYCLELNKHRLILTWSEFQNIINVASDTGTVKFATLEDLGLRTTQELDSQNLKFITSEDSLVKPIPQNQIITFSEQGFYDAIKTALHKIKKQHQDNWNQRLHTRWENELNELKAKPNVNLSYESIVQQHKDLEKQLLDIQKDVQNWSEEIIDQRSTDISTGIAFKHQLFDDQSIEDTIEQLQQQLIEKHKLIQFEEAKLESTIEEIKHKFSEQFNKPQITHLYEKTIISFWQICQQKNEIYKQDLNKFSKLFQNIKSILEYKNNSQKIIQKLNEQIKQDLPKDADPFWFSIPAATVVRQAKMSQERKIKTNLVEQNFTSFDYNASEHYLGQLKKIEHNLGVLSKITEEIYQHIPTTEIQMTSLIISQLDETKNNLDKFFNFFNNLELLKTMFAQETREIIKIKGNLNIKIQENSNSIGTADQTQLDLFRQQDQQYQNKLDLLSQHQQKIDQLIATNQIILQEAVRCYFQVEELLTSLNAKEEQGSLPFWIAVVGCNVRTQMALSYEISIPIEQYLSQNADDFTIVPETQKAWQAQVKEGMYTQFPHQSIQNKQMGILKATQQNNEILFKEFYRYLENTDISLSDKANILEHLNKVEEEMEDLYKKHLLENQNSQADRHLLQHFQDAQKEITKIKQQHLNSEQQQFRRWRNQQQMIMIEDEQLEQQQEQHENPNFIRQEQSNSQ